VDTLLGSLMGHIDDVHSVAFLPDVLNHCQCLHDQTLRVWNAEIGSTLLGPVEGHTSWIYSEVFCPSGNQMLTGSADQAGMLPWGDFYIFLKKAIRHLCTLFSPECLNRSSNRYVLKTGQKKLICIIVNIEYMVC